MRSYLCWISRIWGIESMDVGDIMEALKVKIYYTYIYSGIQQSNISSMVPSSSPKPT